MMAEESTAWPAGYKAYLDRRVGLFDEMEYGLDA